MAKAVFHPETQAEYQAALAWYQARSPGAATGFEAEVERILALIEASPEAFPMLHDDHRFAVLSRYPYSIVYRVTPDDIVVVAVAHSARQPGYWQGRN